MEKIMNGQARVVWRRERKQVAVKKCYAISAVADPYALLHSHSLPPRRVLRLLSPS